MANTGMESWLKGRDAFLRDAEAIMFHAVNTAGDRLLEEMKQLTMRIDHDLEALRKMGHPYGWGADRPPNVPHSDWIVHLQRGDLYGGLRRLPATVTNRQVETLFLSSARHTWYVLLGTRKMRPRDFVTAAMLIQEQSINRLFENALQPLLDRATPGGYQVRVVPLPHDQFPAQLPGGQ